MIVERQRIGERRAPFPVYGDLADRLADSHQAPASERVPIVAHVLGVAAAYAYGDLATVDTIAGRLGLAGGAVVRMHQTVDAMLIYSTAYLLQSRCGRVVILAYRGTELANPANWLGDADVDVEPLTVGGERVGVHAGFHRNLRATRRAILDELELALDGRSLADPGERTDHPLEALYVTGHSLGGALALLFALTLRGPAGDAALEPRVRAVYTFGQPLALSGLLPEGANLLARNVFRHVLPRDVVPSLPAAAWGAFSHVGREFRYEDGSWHESPEPTAQLASLRELPRSLGAMLPGRPGGKRARYSVAAHGPHRYLAALRPTELITEFGDRS